MTIGTSACSIRGVAVEEVRQVDEDDAGEAALGNVGAQAAVVGAVGMTVDAEVKADVVRVVALVQRLPRPDVMPPRSGFHCRRSRGEAEKTSAKSCRWGGWSTTCVPTPRLAVTKPSWMRRSKARCTVTGPASNCSCSNRPGGHLLAGRDLSLHDGAAELVEDVVAFADGRASRRRGMDRGAPPRGGLDTNATGTGCRGQGRDLPVGPGVGVEEGSAGGDFKRRRLAAGDAEAFERRSSRPAAVSRRGVSVRVCRAGLIEGRWRGGGSAGGCRRAWRRRR